MEGTCQLQLCLAEIPQPRVTLCALGPTNQKAIAMVTFYFSPTDSGPPKAALTHHEGETGPLNTNHTGSLRTSA